MSIKTKESMRRASVLYIIDTFLDLAGAERNLFEVVTRLDKRKYKPIVYALRAGSLIDVLKQNGIYARNLGIDKIYSLKAIREGIKLIRFIKKEHTRIVVTYHESSDFWGGIIAKIAGTPVIISSRRDMGYNLKKKHFLGYKFINNLIFNKIMTVSDAVKDLLVEKQNTSQDRIVTIYNGAELNKFSKKTDNVGLKKELGLKPKVPIVGIIAGLRRIKGHKYFLEAASIILKENKNVQFLIVGWHGDDGYPEELKNFTKDMGIDRNVIFTGARYDVSEILSISDISVLSSLSEGFSNTILESMAAGKPIVATDVGGNPEAVVNGETGLLVPPGDSGALARAILKLLRNKDLARKMGESGKRRIEGFFTLDRMIEDIETLYDILLGKKCVSGKTLVRAKLSKLVKISVSSFLYYSGIINLFVRIKPENRIRILAYHKISDEYPYLNLTTTVPSFKKQIEYLKEYCHIISLSEAVDLLKTKRKIPRSTVVLTFDDGYKCTYHNAFPELKKYRIPATVFLTVNPIEYKEPLWFEFITCAINDTLRKTLDLEYFGLKKYLINTPGEKNQAIEHIATYVKKLNTNDRKDFLKILSQKLLIDSNNSKITDGNMLSWEEIREMKKEGISFGAHTMTHSILTNIPLKEAQYEVCQSRKIIEERLGGKTTFFAYTNGGWNDFNGDIINILKDNQFTCACTLINGTNNTNLFALRRDNIHEELASSTSGLFFKPLFVTETSGIFEHLFRRFLRKEVAV